MKTIFVTKVSAYADEMICYVESRSLTPLVDRVRHVCDVTQLSVNIVKTEILSRESTQKHETQKKIKVLELNIRSMTRRTTSLLSKKFQRFKIQLERCPGKKIQ